MPLSLPKFPDETAEEFATLVATDRDGQLSVQAAVNRALADISANMDRENARIDAGVKTAEDTITAAVKHAGGRVQGAAANAKAHVDRARGAQGRRVASQLNTKKAAVPGDVKAVVDGIKDVGTRKADEAQKVADDAATDLENSRDGYVKRARQSGTDHAARASSSADEPEIRRASIGAQQKAATDVAEQTAKSIDDAITSSVGDLRGGGPKLHSATSEKLTPVLQQVRDQIDPMQQAIAGVGTQLTTTLDDSVANARTTIEATARGLMNALAAIDRQTKTQLRTAAETTKKGLKQAQAEGERELHGKAGEFVTAAHTELGRHLQLISSRPVRRMLARRLANELRSLLRDGYGTGAAQANQLAGRIAGKLSAALAQFHQELTAATQPATAGADSTATSGGQQFGQLERQVVDFLAKSVTDALEQLDTSQTNRIVVLGKTVDAVEDKLSPFVTDTRTQVTGDKKKLEDDALAKLGTLDDRLDQAMTKAHDKAEYGAVGAWLMDQLRQLGKAMLTPSFWAGLLVGLLITILIVATFGGGLAVLVIAGAVAGALSAAAAYTAECFLDPLVDPKAPHKKFDPAELGKQMAIGAAVGAVGALVGGAAGAGVKAITSRVVVDKVAQTVVGTALGVVQNVITGPDGSLHWPTKESVKENWDKGLLTNAVVSAAMTSKRIAKIQDRARNTMVDRGLAYNVTPEEFGKSQTRMSERAGGTEPAVEPHTPVAPDLSGVHVEPVAPTAPPEVKVAAPIEPHAAPPPVAAEPHAPAPPPTAAEPHAAAPPPVAAEPHALAPPVAPAEPHTPAAPQPKVEAPPPHAPESKQPATTPAAEREAVAHTPPSDEHAPVGDHVKEIDLPDHTVISTDEGMSHADAKHVYENARSHAPQNEVAVFRNSETGEHIVIQGNPDTVENRSSYNKALAEFEQSRPGKKGRWDLVEHSHPVDKATGVTPERDRFPSGRGGDYHNAKAESLARGGAPVEQKIGIVTERGNETVTYGYDPSHEKPYSLQHPGPDGKPVTERFGSMEDYGKWYERNAPGGGTPHIDGGSGTAAAPSGKAAGKTKPKPPPLPERAKRAAAAREPAVPAPRAAEHAPAPVERAKPAKSAKSAAAPEHPTAPERPAVPKTGEKAAVTPAEKAAPAKKPLPPDPVDTFRDTAGKLRDPEGHFTTDPRTAIEKEIVASAEKGDSTEHKTPSKQPKEFKAELKDRNAAQAKSEKDTKQVKDLCEKAGIDPKDLVHDDQREKTLNRLRKKGVSERRISALEKAEEARQRSALELKQSSERLGMLAGEDVLKSGGEKVISGDPDVPGKANTLDLIGLNPKGDHMTVVEAKGGKADLSEGRYIEELGGKAEQGSPEYLNDLLHKDQDFRAYLDAHPDFAKRLASGRVEIDYVLVSARPDGTVVKTVLRLDVRPGALKLSDLAPSKKAR